MSAFRFRLQRVLDWDESRRKVTENKIRELMAERNGVRDDMSRLRSECAAAEQAVYGSSHLDGSSLVALGSYRERIGHRLAAGQKTLQRIEQDLQEQQQIWIRAKRRCRAMESLKERRAAEFAYEEGRKRESETADFVVSRWRRDNEQQAAASNNQLS
jgi:flagellar export protein FliJ